MAMVIRAELVPFPDCRLVEPDFFNQMTTMHALIMVFGAVMPAWVGFANWHDSNDGRRTRTWPYPG